MHIHNCQNIFFQILYFPTATGSPIDLTEKNGKHHLSSVMLFSKDHAQIRSDGTYADNSILFGPTIARKQIGAALPSNFTPIK